MKKLFKSNKPKNSELNPTPLTLPPDTPIHDRHNAPQSAPVIPPSRRSTDMSGLADRGTWVVLDPSLDDAGKQARTRKDSKPSSVVSLPLGASAPQSALAGNPLPVRHSQQQAPPPQSLPQPPRSPSSNTHPTVKEPTKRKSGQIFPWPDSRLPDHHPKSASTDDRPNSQRPSSMYSVDTHDTHDIPKDKDVKSSTGARISEFFFSSNKEVTKQATKHPKEPQYDIEEVISEYYFLFIFASFRNDRTSLLSNLPNVRKPCSSLNRRLDGRI